MLFCGFWTLFKNFYAFSFNFSIWAFTYLETQHLNKFITKKKISKWKKHLHNLNWNESISLIKINNNNNNKIVFVQCSIENLILLTRAWFVDENNWNSIGLQTMCVRIITIKISHFSIFNGLNATCIFWQKSNPHIKWWVVWLWF